MKPLPPILIDLAKAFADGDDSALNPLVDCLTENGWEHHADRIRYMFSAYQARSVYLLEVVRGDVEEMVGSLSVLRCDDWTEERKRELGRELAGRKS